MVPHFQYYVHVLMARVGIHLHRSPCIVAAISPFAMQYRPAHEKLQARLSLGFSIVSLT